MAERSPLHLRLFAWLVRRDQRPGTSARWGYAAFRLGLFWLAWCRVRASLRAWWMPRRPVLMRGRTYDELRAVLSRTRQEAAERSALPATLDAAALN